MNTNYSGYSKEPVTSGYVAIINDSDVEEIVDDAYTEMTVEESKVDDAKIGRVVGGDLYLREKPSSNSEPVTVLKDGEEIMITKDIDHIWVAVYTAIGQEGFCKKEFIKTE